MWFQRVTEAPYTLPDAAIAGARFACEDTIEWMR